MRRFNILIFNWRDITHPWAGGAERHIHEVSKRLVNAGHTVTLFCARYEGAKDVEKIDGIEIIRKGGRFSVYVYAFWEYVTKLKKRNFDLIIDDINAIPWFTPLYIRKPKIAIIHHFAKYIFFEELPFLLAIIAYCIELSYPFIYRKIPFITVSPSSRDEMVNVGIPEEHITIVTHGVDHQVHKPSEYSKSPYPHLLYLGRLRNYKNLGTLIQAMALVVKEIPSVKLSIVGAGAVQNKLKALAASLNLSDSITFYGYVDDEMKRNFFQNAWVFVTSSEKEGWGLTVIEANACGTPAVAFAVPGLKDSIQNGETGLLVENRSSDAFAERIIELLKDEELRKRLSVAALKHAQQFSWDKAAEEYMNIMEQVANEL